MALVIGVILIILGLIQMFRPVSGFTGGFGRGMIGGMYITIGVMLALG